jgi:lipoate-protein ligase A
MFPPSPFVSRSFSRHVSLSTFAKSQPAYLFRSTTSDPFLNLSIEHHLFTTSPPGSKLLFLYTNSPSVIIGRNQNPWAETNLPDLFARNAHLVRRRSGGGTVWHDEGNVNWSITTDMSLFTRDKHAEMVVRALRTLGVDRARVNERHDIVLDLGNEKREVDNSDTHSTHFGGDTTKVSGSAYKLARNRALHHGTALLDSSFLSSISHVLKSPWKQGMNMRGTESVRSKVGNLGLTNHNFEQAVELEFRQMYQISPDQAPIVEVGEEYLDIDQVNSGYQELKSDEWIWEQTPSFESKVELPEYVSRRPVCDQLKTNCRRGYLKFQSNMEV